MMEFAGVLAIAGCCFALVDIAFQLHGIRDSLRGIVQVRDVDRAKVYSEHLGGKLRG